MCGAQPARTSARCGRPSFSTRAPRASPRPKQLPSPANLISTVLGPQRRTSVPDPIDLLVVTRGTGQPPELLTVDATALVGWATPTARQ